MANPRTILITGASGALGKQLIYELTRRGERPIAMVRANSHTAYIDSLGLEKRVADLRKIEELHRAVAGVDVVIHCAAWISFRQDRFTQFTGINTFGAVYLYEAARDAGVKRFVHVSSIAGFGAAERHGEPLTEAAEFNLNLLRIPYCLTKHAAERELARLAADGGPELVIVIPPTLLAPSRNNDRHTRTQRFLMRRLLPGIKNRINIADIRDVAPAIIAAADRGRANERYLLTGENLRFTELVTLVAAELGQKPFILPVPRWLVMLAARAYLGWARFRGKGRISFYPDLVRMLDYDWVYDNTKARRELGFSPRPLRETLHDLFAGTFSGTWKHPA